jgi:signal transduction histidine kinase
VIVADLLEFSHQTRYELEPIEINEVVRKTLGILENQPLYHNIEFKLNLAESLPSILGNSIRLNQVMMNLLVNGAQAMQGNGAITISSRKRAHNEIVELVISDTGPGIEEDHLEKVFEPFFTTKTTGEGTGLGLSVSFAIVKEHQGTIKVSSEPGNGAVFTLRFPAVVDTLKGENHAH